MVHTRWCNNAVSDNTVSPLPVTGPVLTGSADPDMIWLAGGQGGPSGGCSVPAGTTITTSTSKTDDLTPNTWDCTHYSPRNLSALAQASPPPLFLLSSSSLSPPCPSQWGHILQTVRQITSHFSPVLSLAPLCRRSRGLNHTYKQPGHNSDTPAWNVSKYEQVAPAESLQSW